ncbi:hypothetical protein QQF64_003560 [Cirrhinus molitorella]|uniref:Uncharacterized protein n=1 Tax=Cirrhinus molitorella TaxID=172907 RepID=A0ABR3MLN0_9TELE
MTGTRASQSIEDRKRSTRLDQYFIPDSSNTVSRMHSAEPELSRDQRNSISAGQARGTPSSRVIAAIIRSLWRSAALCLLSP